MKKTLLFAVLIISVALIGSAMAIGTGKMEYESKMGKVTFDSKTHKDAKLSCKDCHPQPFGPMAKHAERIKIPVPHKTGEDCGTCHDGTKAFSQTDEASCKKCHKKEAGGY